MTRVAGSNPGVVDFLIFDFDFFSIKIDSSIFLKGNSVWNFSASFELEWQQQPTLEAALNPPQLWQAFLSLKKHDLPTQYSFFDFVGLKIDSSQSQVEASKYGALCHVTFNFQPIPTAVSS